MTREEAILWLQVLKHCKVNWVGEQAEDEDIIARCEEAEQEAFDMAIEALSAESVQGEWIDVENEPYCECSVCGSYIDNLDDDYTFCPRCGARMKGGAE